MVLSDKGGSGKVSEVKSLNFCWTYLGIGKARVARLDGEGAQIAVWKRSKCGFSDAD